MYRPNAAPHRRTRRLLFSCALLPISGIMLIVGSATPARSYDHEPVVRVEEDWELLLNQPNGAVIAPQFHTVMSPYNNLDSLFAQVTWNYRELGSFLGGGLQMQGWNNDVSVVEREFFTAAMSSAAETIRWTQTLQTNGSQMTFQISNGHSATWGTFGYPGQNMKITASIDLPTLNSYDPASSAANSAVTYGTNRVEILRITEVRTYGPNGLMSVDETPRVVFKRNY